jgi:hypothetical protein
MLLFLFSYHRLFIIFSLSLSLSLFIGIFFSSLSITEKERRHHFYCCCLFSLFLSQPKILPASVYTYISIRRSASVCAPFLFSPCIGQIWPLYYYYYPDSSIRFCIYLRTRIECAYTYTRTKRNHQWYIYKSDVRFYTHPRWYFFLLLFAFTNVHILYIYIYVCVCVGSKWFINM